MAKEKKPEIVDLEKEVLLRISSDPEVNSIPWEVLKEVGNNLEKLIQALAQNAAGSDTYDQGNFQLNFTGFYKGSAVPAFSLAKSRQLSLQTDSKVRTQVKEDFSYVMAKLSAGKFDEITRPFPTPEVKNQILQRVAGLSVSAGHYAISVAKRDKKGNIKPLYRVRPISEQVVKQLLNPVVKEENDTFGEPIPAVARVLIKRSKTGKESRKTTSIFVGKETEPSMRFDSIPAKNRVYELNHPVTFFVVEEGKGVILENQELDIYAPGRTTEEAKMEAFEQFDESYRRLTKLSDKKLSNHLLTAKRLLKIAVKSVSKTK